MPHTDTTSTQRLDYKPPNFRIDSVDLRFHLSLEKTQVTSVLAIHNSNPPGDPIQLDGRNLQLVSVHIDDQALDTQDYDLSDNALLIRSSSKHFQLKIVTDVYPNKNTALEGLYQSNHFLLTQCEAEGFRKITFFPDRPDIMARYRVTLIADRTDFPILLSNGNLESAGDLKQNQHFATWDDPHRKPSYLFALVAGDLRKISKHYQTVDGRQVQLNIYAEHHNIDKCSHAMESLINAMQWDEQRFGLCYDLNIYNIVATDDFNMGAMENKGLNVFNSKYVLANPETASDTDFQMIEAVIGHEYFHNWTGNRVTCRDWFQLSLKEGLTVFRDQEFSADMQSAAVKRIDDVKRLRTAQFAEDAGPMSHSIRPESYIDINNFYTLTVYEKGAEIVRMYQTLLGVEGFRKGMDCYFQRHDGQAVTCDDFLQAMADANQTDLDQFSRWYSQTGTPEVSYSSHFDSTRKQLTMTFTQQLTSGIKKPLHIPIKVALFSNQGEAIELHSTTQDKASFETVIELTNTVQSYCFEQIKEPPIPSLLRGFSAPIILHQQQNDSDLALLMSRDSDAFNRWDAAQSYCQRIIMNIFNDPDYSIDSAFILAFKKMINDDQLDPALKAATMTLPSEIYLGDQLEIIDVEKIHKARKKLKQELSDQLTLELRALYSAHTKDDYSKDDYSKDSRSIANRQMKNCCLSYLALNSQGADICKSQFENANNMTDSITALSELVQHRHPFAKHALDEFYARWHHESLVMDKWLAIQASTPDASTVDTVKALCKHSVVDMTNPNKVRSLVGTFVHGNRIGFHQNNGAGYQFLADIVSNLDDINPQIAAKLVSAFNSWRRYDPSRQKLMKSQLIHISNRNNLSNAVYEIVSKALG